MKQCQPITQTLANKGFSGMRRVVARINKTMVTLLIGNPKTGRTHPLRIHLMQTGTSIVADRLFEEKESTIMPGVLYLTAAFIACYHPVNYNKIDVFIPFP